MMGAGPKNHRSHVNGKRGKRLLQKRQESFDEQCKRLERTLVKREREGRKVADENK